MRYYRIDLYTGKATSLTETEFNSRKIGLGKGIKGARGEIITYRGEEEILIKQVDTSK